MPDGEKRNTPVLLVVGGIVFLLVTVVHQSCPPTVTSSKTVGPAPGASETETTTPATIETTRTSGTPRSETLAIALLGFGVALLLAGAFYDRIESLTAPGIVIKLRDVAEKLKEDVAKALKTIEKQDEILRELRARVATLPGGQQPPADPLDKLLHESRDLLNESAKAHAETANAITDLKAAVE